MEGVTEVKAKIIECVGLIINNWSVVQLALDHGWVSKNHKRMKESEEAAEFSKVKKLNETEDDVKQRFITELSDFIYDFEVSRFDIEDFIADFVEENFYVVLEDESQKFVAKLLDDLNKTLSEGNDKVYNEIKEMAKKYAKKEEESKTEDEKGEQENANNESGTQITGNKENDEEPPQLIDEDGFVTVTTKKGKKKK